LAPRLTSLHRGSLVELATRQLHDEITAASWPVGGRIPAETELAERLGVGRSTVREAVRALVHAGLLESRQGSGTFVRALCPTEWGSLVRKAEVLEVYEVRGGLEFQAARLACVRRTDADIERIDAALHERLAAWRRGRDPVFVEADLTFHRAVVAAAHNELLERMYDGFVPVLRDTLIVFVTRDPLDREISSGVKDAHAALAEAIRAGDQAAAVAATSANLDVTSASLEHGLLI
jgi:GntR family transcriptional regulator, transcriptional repressor for pyruvate dehydrogenase complex